LARAPPVITAPGVCKTLVPICGVRSAALTSGVAACAITAELVATAEFVAVERNAGVAEGSPLLLVVLLLLVVVLLLLAAVPAPSCRTLGGGTGV